MSGYRDLLLKGNRVTNRVTKESLFKDDGDYDDDNDEDGRDLKALKASLFGPQKAEKGGSPLASDEEIMGMSESELTSELKKPENMRKMMKILQGA